MLLLWTDFDMSCNKIIFTTFSSQNRYKWRSLSVAQQLKVDRVSK